MLVNVALSISCYLHIDSSSPIAVKVVGVKSIITRDLVSSRQTAKIHPDHYMNARDLEVSISVVGVVMRVDFKINDLVSLIADVLNVVGAVLYSLLQHWQKINVGISVISWDILPYIGLTVVVIVCYSQRPDW